MDGFKRTEAVPMADVLGEYLRDTKLGRGLNIRRVFSAWDRVSGAAEHTSKYFFKNGTLYLTIDSSVVRSNLYLQQDVLLRAVNDELAKDPLFNKNDPDCRLVSKIVLK